MSPLAQEPLRDIEVEATAIAILVSLIILPINQPAELEADINTVSNDESVREYPVETVW